MASLWSACQATLRVQRRFRESIRDRTGLGDCHAQGFGRCDSARAHDLSVSIDHYYNANDSLHATGRCIILLKLLQPVKALSLMDSNGTVRMRRGS